MGHRRISPPQPPEILHALRGTTIALHLRVASMLHEVLVDLFRRNPAILVDLVRPHVDGLLDPDDLHVDIDDSAFSRAPIHSDLVLVVRDAAGRPRVVFIIEPQLRVDHRKYFSWPSYQADGHRRYGCPCYLVVVTNKPDVAAWAAGPIRTGQTELRPLVLGPRAIPILDEDHPVDLDHASVDTLLLCGLVHHGDDLMAERIGTALWKALARAGTDLEHGDRYWDLFLSTINEATRRLLMLKFDNYAPQSEWGKRFYAEGHSEGLRKGHSEGLRKGHSEGLRKGHSEGLRKGHSEGLRKGHSEGLTEGRRQTLLLLLDARALTPDDHHREAITTCTDSALLERWIRRAATATSTDDVFGPPLTHA